MSSPFRRTWPRGLAALFLIAAAVLLLIAYDRVFRELPQADWIHSTPEMRFKYGSIGAEQSAGMPYWIFYVLPRVFPEKLRQNDQVASRAYAAFGLSWEPGQELPIGFTKKTIGFPRVANNCAVCHTASFRSSPDAEPTFVVGGPAHTANVAELFRYLIDCAKDPRFNADILMDEIDRVTDLDLLDKLLYRFFIIPITQKRLLEREPLLAWISRADFPEWGRGRDEAMNRIKYGMIRAPMDDTFGPTDIPSVWNLKKYLPEHGDRLNYAGESYDVYSAIMDSSLGLLDAAPANREDFIEQVKWLHGFLSQLPAPKYPFAIDADQAAIGRALFDGACARCHVGELTGRPLPWNYAGTDRGRLDTWNRSTAQRANQAVKEMGLERHGLVEEDPQGYVAPFLDGIWLRAPYLHNGSVPTLRDLLEWAADRPRTFWRGYDVYDPKKVGFVSDGPEAQRAGSLFDTTQRGNSRQGHEYGVNFSAAEKEALLEYLKTL